MCCPTRASASPGGADGEGPLDEGREAPGRAGDPARPGTAAGLPDAPPSSGERESPAWGPPFTAEDIRRHDTRDNCWLIINRRVSTIPVLRLQSVDVEPFDVGGSAGTRVTDTMQVHDVTRLVDVHPGGDVILTHAGRDATDVFTAFHAASTWCRLKEFYIGDLQVLTNPPGLESGMPALTPHPCAVKHTTLGKAYNIVVAEMLPRRCYNKS